LPSRVPPMSTLSPYTTLFRSGPPPVKGAMPRGRGGEDRASGDLDHRNPADPRTPLARAGLVHRGAVRIHRHGHRHVADLEFVDQIGRSTRLNSSHVKISYAVF